MSKYYTVYIKKLSTCNRKLLKHSYKNKLSFILNIPLFLSELGKLISNLIIVRTSLIIRDLVFSFLTSIIDVKILMQVNGV